MILVIDGKVLNVAQRIALPMKWWYLRKPTARQTAQWREATPDSRIAAYRGGLVPSGTEALAEACWAATDAAGGGCAQKILKKHK